MSLKPNETLRMRSDFPGEKAPDVKPPWQQGPLSEWAIVGMNHYHMDGERRLFVSMAKGNRCIKEEGADDKYLWNRLMHQAWKIAEETPNG